MLAKDTFDCLRDFGRNNNREWFHENNPQYEAARDDFANFETALMNQIAMFDDALTGTLAADCVFRIFRDVRFSKNKDPYKTNFGAFIAQGRRKCLNPGYYIHIEPKQCSVAGGAYHPEPAQLFKIRKRIAANSKEFFDAISASAFRKTFGDLS